MSDIRSYCNPWKPRFTKESQLEKLSGEIYTEDKTGAVIDALIHSVRKGSIVEVVELGLLAPIPGKSITPQKRRKLLADRVERIKARGGSIRELATGSDSKKGHLPRMLMRAAEFISNSGRAEAKQGTPGRPGIKLTPEQDEKGQLIWQNRRYENDAQRVAALKRGLKMDLKPGWCWRRWGSPHGKEAK
jgi:hypothetical protein